MKPQSGLIHFLGVQPNAHLAEKTVATLGGVLVIAITAWVGLQVAGVAGAMAILPSMGAATVLLFAAPHAPLSQPWALFGGNLLSALVGVTCARYVPDPVWAQGLAVGLAILVMHVCRCLHPPGGATALAAVMGGGAIRQLGYDYVLVPTLLNCIVLFGVALLFNNLFPWRRYPASLMKYRSLSLVGKKKLSLTVDDIETAMQESGVILDANPEQILDILEHAQAILQRRHTHDFDLEIGAFYTNGLPGLRWSVRQVVDEAPHEDPARHLVIYRTVDGADRLRSGSCTLVEFSQWAAEKMTPAR